MEQLSRRHLSGCEAVRPGRGKKILLFRFDPGDTWRVFTVSELQIRQDSAGDIGASEHSRQSSTTLGEVQSRSPLASSGSLSAQRRRPTITSPRLGQPEFPTGSAASSPYLHHLREAKSILEDDERVVTQASGDRMDLDSD